MNGEFSEKVLDSNVVVISVGRYLDNSNAHILLEQLGKAIEANSGRILLDMKECELMSSSGVGAIISNIEAARAVGCDITLVEPSEAVMTILEALGLTDTMSIQFSTSEPMRGVTKS